MKKKKSNLIVEEITVEREIAEFQLERLRQTARERLLTYEEVRIYDILTKNLLLSKGQATDIIASASRVNEVEATSNEKLIEVAAAVDESIIDKALEFVTDDKQEPKN